MSGITQSRPMLFIYKPHGSLSTSANYILIIMYTCTCTSNVKPSYTSYILNLVLSHSFTINLTYAILA